MTAGSIDTALAWHVLRGADRIEPGLLVTWHPCLLGLLALSLGRSRRGVRLAGYAAMLATAGLGQAILLGGQAGRVLRALAACGALAVLVDIVVRAGIAIHGRGMAAIGLAILLAVPGGGEGYDRLAVGDADRPTGQRIAVLAGVPLRWRQADTGLPAGPSDAWRMLAALFVLEPADDPAILPTSRWLLVQPRVPTATALVAMDARIRAGARAVILTDPDLRWPSRYPAGDAAAPPRSGTLRPLLLHWGLGLDRGPRGAGLRDVVRGGRWRLALAGAGRFTRVGAGPCRLSAKGLIADCRIGRGRAILVADADLLDGSWWTDGAGGWQPAWRRSDNAAFVASLIAGLDRIDPPAAPVRWRPDAPQIGTRQSAIIPAHP